MRLFFHKLTNWEYWPYKIVYFPIYFLWAYYALRSKTIFFFNAANPGIKNGGFINESKKEIYNLIPPQYYPKTELFKEGTPAAQMKTVFEKSGIRFPLIAKPDIGLRGSAVKKINTFEEMLAYNRKANFDYIIQDFIPYPNEMGIFYVRYPKEKTGRITGIVAKEFLIVTGDGVSTIENLLKKDPRHELQSKALQAEYGKALKEVLPKGKELNLVPYGNHCRGAKFLDISHKVTPQMNELMNKICLQIPGFYFGRLDIMFNTIEEFEQGQNFSIIELNGAASEPTHIYDPSHSLLFAWKELIRHIRYMYAISKVNHNNGTPFLTHKEGMQQYRLHQKHNQKIMSF